MYYIYFFMLILQLFLYSCNTTKYFEIKEDYYFGENFGLPGQAAVFVKVEYNKAFVQIYNHYYIRAYAFMFADTLERDKIDTNKFISQHSIIFLKNNKIYYENIKQLPITYSYSIPKTKLHIDTTKHKKIHDTINNKLTR